MLLPLIRFAFISGGTIRVESLTGREGRAGGHFLINQGIFFQDGDGWVVTHLQKYSHFGFMWTKPFGFHVWLFWRRQKADKAHHWIPGTEQGIYARLPGYRWDAELGMIRTGGYFGLHWD